MKVAQQDGGRSRCQTSQSNHSRSPGISSIPAPSAMSASRSPRWQRASTRCWRCGCCTVSDPDRPFSSAPQSMATKSSAPPSSRGLRANCRARILRARSCWCRCAISSAFSTTRGTCPTAAISTVRFPAMKAARLQDSWRISSSPRWSAAPLSASISTPQRCTATICHRCASQRGTNGWWNSPPCSARRLLSKRPYAKDRCARWHRKSVSTCCCWKRARRCGSTIFRWKPDLPACCACSIISAWSRTKTGSAKSAFRPDRTRRNGCAPHAAEWRTGQKLRAIRCMRANCWR